MSTSLDQSRRSRRIACHGVQSADRTRRRSPPCGGAGGRCPPRGYERRGAGWCPNAPAASPERAGRLRPAAGCRPGSAPAGAGQRGRYQARASSRSCRAAITSRSCRASIRASGPADAIGANRRASSWSRSRCQGTPPVPRATPRKRATSPAGPLTVSRFNSQSVPAGTSRWAPAAWREAPCPSRSLSV